MTLFIHRLALALGKHLSEIRAMPADDLFSWMAYARKEPFGEERADLRVGYATMKLASVTANVKQGTVFKLDEFIPKFGRKVRRQAPDEIMLTLFSALGGPGAAAKLAAQQRRRKAGA